ncbi:hypothetical protein GCM10018781_79160 [Kitasatospora indigofera]|uniref:Tetratricopeptide repeat protein n=1 Tax=Kitasatospora indigofera TaxID=67307 RepID=A0A919DAS0_9ACTN|nr:tetratricopeptide repeat protein [Kitasatospora indigofera]GHE26747.1 hypothetical protein GCM10018781_79160 [Kitasatospora indigofera]
MRIPGAADEPDGQPGEPGRSGQPGQRVVAEAGFAYGAIGADIHVFGDGTPVYLLKNWRPEDPVDDGWLRELPSRMLNARWEVVGFTGRTEELAGLRSWCADGPRLAVRWLHAPGGQGKTRLAARLAREMAAEGWKVVTATEGPGTVLPPPGSQDLRLDGAAGLLLLVEYADRWPLSHLTWLLSNALLHRRAVPARVLMIARDTGPWPAVRAALADHRAGTSTQALAALGDPDDPAGPRGRMFLAARDGFAAQYGVISPGGTAPPPWLEGSEFGLTLAVHMAALVTVDARSTGRRTPTDMAGLTLYLLDREHLHWARRHGDGTHRLGGRESPGPPWATPPEVMNRVVFTAALTGPLAPPAGAQVIGRLGLGLPAERVLADHASCYPPVGPARATVLEPLHPDRLAEDFTALTLPGHPADYPAGPWARGTVQALTEGPPHPGWIRRTVNLLAVAADRWPHIGAGHLFPLLRERPGLAVEAGSSALSALAALPDAPLDLLEAVESHLPAHDHTDLAPGAADLACALAQRRLARTDDPATRAAIHARLAVALAGAGRYRENLTALEEAARLYRPLAEADPQAFEPRFAKVLSNLATRLGRYGRQQEALALSQEAVDIAGRAGWLDAGAPVSAGGALLVNLANRQRAAGRTVAALETEHRALEIFWQLSRTDPAEDVHLAPCLANLASLLPMGYLRGRGALAALEQAVLLYRRLAADEPSRHEASLAYALTVLAGRIAGDNQLAEAIATAAPGFAGLPAVTPERRQRAVDLATEAVRIDRRLVTANPAVLELQLADGLMVLHRALAAAGRPDEAAAALAESTLVRARLADPDPESPAGGGEEPYPDPDPAEHRAMTMAGVRAGVTLFAYLAETDPGAYRDGLAEALQQVTAVATFDRAGLPDREAVLPHWRRLADEDLTAHGPGLVHALAVICSVQRTAGLHEQAARTTEERERWAARIAAAEQERARRRHAPRIPWGTAEDIDREAQRLTTAGDPAGLWTLVLSVPLTDGIRLARALLHRLPPPDVATRSLAERLAAAEPPTVPPPGSVAAPRTALPAHYGTGEGLSFAHGRPALTLHGVQPDGTWALRAVDLGSGRVRRLHRGDRYQWLSVACLGPRRAVGLRTLPHPPDLELALLDRGREERLAWGDALRGARLAATAEGYVVGLRAMRAVLVGTGGDAPVPVPMDGTGLRRCDRLAVDPAGTRIALTDGHRIVLAALPGAAVIADAGAAGAAELLLLGPDRLLTAGANGGLRRWELRGRELSPTGEVAAPVLEHLFAVPAWRVVGGWAFDRPYFFDSQTLEPVPEPPATSGFQDRTMTWKVSPDGRFVAHGGWPPQSGPEEEPRTVCHDLQHPSAWLARPAAAVTAADLPALEEAARRADRRLRPLLRLLRDCCVHRLSVDRPAD